MNNSPETNPTSAPPAAPRWVKILGIVALVIVVLVLIILGLGIGGEHGPGRHNPSGLNTPSLRASKPAEGWRDAAKQSPSSNWTLVAQ